MKANWVRFKTERVIYYINETAAVQINKRTGEIVILTPARAEIQFRTSKDLNEFLRLIGCPPVRI